MSRVDTQNMLDGLTAVVTGGGRGIGRAEVLALAAAGASVVVNDPGYGTGDAHSDPSVAQAVVDEVKAAGGKAVADVRDCSDWEEAAGIVQGAVDAFGGLDVVVNNAGILREGMSFNLDAADFDDVMRVHVRGHMAMARHAGAYWRSEHKAGRRRPARMVNTTSDSGLFGQPGIVGYSVAKAAIVALTTVLAQELDRYGVLVNALAPSAFRTRLLSGPAAERARPAASEAGAEAGWDPLDPAHIGSTVVWLASPALTFSGRVVWSSGDSVELYEGWRPVSRVARPGRRLTVEDLVAGSWLQDGSDRREPALPPQGCGHWDWFHSAPTSGQASSSSRT